MPKQRCERFCFFLKLNLSFFNIIMFLLNPCLSLTADKKNNTVQVKKSFPIGAC